MATFRVPLSGLLDSYARLGDKILYSYTGALLGLLFRCICVGRGAESGVWLMVIGDTTVGMSYHVLGYKHTWFCLKIS